MKPNPPQPRETINRADLVPFSPETRRWAQKMDNSIAKDAPVHWMGFQRLAGNFVEARTMDLMTSGRF